MKRLYAVAAVLLSLAACSPKDAEPEIHWTTGVVREVKDGGATLTIEHKEFPGFMQAMTMDFKVGVMDLAKEVKAGDSIQFTITKKDESWPITGLKVTASAAAPMGDCVMGSAKGLTVRWRAFKTPKKAKVEGILKDIKSEGPDRAETWQKLVLAQTLSIGGGEDSVDSGDAVRDAKLSKFFFLQMAGRIGAKATRIDEAAKKLYLDITMNGKTAKGVAMEYMKEGDTLKAKGKIDVLDFGASKALASINEACSEKHEGKTWSDVEIGLEAAFKACG